MKTNDLTLDQIAAISLRCPMKMPQGNSYKDILAGEFFFMPEGAALDPVRLEWIKFNEQSLAEFAKPFRKAALADLQDRRAKGASYEGDLGHVKIGGKAFTYYPGPKAIVRDGFAQWIDANGDRLVRKDGNLAETTKALHQADVKAVPYARQSLTAKSRAQDLPEPTFDLVREEASIIGKLTMAPGIEEKLGKKTFDVDYMMGIEQAKALGMDVLLWTGDGDGKDFSLADTRKVLGGLDNVLSRIVCDEPELHFTGEYVKNFIQSEKKHYPYCPVQMNNTTFGFPSRFADLTTDVFMLDAYFTSAEFGKIEGALRSVDVMVKSDRSTPCWFFLTGANTLHYKQPSYGEQVAQCWSTLCAGCSGLSWFVNLVSAEGNWKAMCDFNREAQQVKDFLLAEEIVEPARASVSGDILRHKLTKVGDAWHLFTVNIDGEPLEKITLTLPAAAPQNGTAEVLFENRTVEIKNGVIVDDYEPFARHIYEVKR